MRREESHEIDNRRGGPGDGKIRFHLEIQTFVLALQTHSLTVPECEGDPPDLSPSIQVRYQSANLARTEPDNLYSGWVCWD